MLSYEAARAKVIEVICARHCAPPPPTETIEFAEDPGRVLGRIVAEDVRADRNYPPFNRSTRDGFALRAADAAQAGAKLRLIGESRAGVSFAGMVEPGTCVQIMTGAAMPRGANSVVMNEHARIEGEYVVLDEAAREGAHFVLEGQETRVGESVIARGNRLGYAELAIAAQVGRSKLVVAKKPRVAILSTGDELVATGGTPTKYQIRNSNNVSLAAQVSLAGGDPVMLGTAPDNPAELRARIQQALEADIVVVTGGVSVGKYDLVEQVLREMGAEFYFDAVAIRPGKPAVFGFCQAKPVFGLPGNPVSTMVTFELFVVPAIDLRSGALARALPFVEVVLAEDLQEKAGMTHFLPARVEWEEGVGHVKALKWQGSGDIGAMVQANCYLVVAAELSHVAAGSRMPILLRGDVV